MRVTTAYLERVAREWQEAFAAAHGSKAPSVSWERGWFRINSTGRRYRRAELEQMTKVLRKGFKD